MNHHLTEQFLNRQRLSHPIRGYLACLGLFVFLASICCALLFSASALAHGVASGDKGYIQEISGVHLLPFVYLGAKHMVTGYDHLLFLFGVIFFLRRLREVGLYVTLFAVGHSTTSLLGVLGGFHVDAYLVDAVIGLSVVYKALDNLGAFRRWFGVQPDTRAAVLVFGFFHWVGLATKLQAFKLSPDGLVPNMLAFNVGVELGQLLTLSAILIAMAFWRRSDAFVRHAFAANTVLMTAGFVRCCSPNMASTPRASARGSGCESCRPSLPCPTTIRPPCELRPKRSSANKPASASMPAPWCAPMRPSATTLCR